MSTKMDRRDFLKLATWAGISVVGVGAPGRTDAEQTPYEGKLYLMIKADGGWDPTMLCDPKGGEINRTYGEGEILTAGAITYAPGLDPVGGGQSFFQKYGSELLVINGIDVSTNSHNPGKRYTWTGRLDNVGYPTFAALTAAVKSPHSSLSHISFGYGATGGVVPLSRLARPDSLYNLAAPYEVYGSQQSGTYHSDTTRAHLDAARNAREQLLMRRHNLPRLQSQMSTMFLSKISLNEFERVQSFLPETLPSHPLEAQAAIVMAAYQAGACVSANLTLGGFDTHANHDSKQGELLNELLQGADRILERASDLGIRDQVVLILGSDFSRTPKYNNGKGKDHWSVGSMMCLGPGVRGNRVIGATTEEQLSQKVDPVTLEVSDGPDAIALKPEHIHRALRRLAGVHDHAYAKDDFLLKAEDLPIFS